MNNTAQRVIEKCGGPDAVAEMLKLGVPSVYKWTYPTERGGTGGHVPTKRQGELLRKATERGIPLKPEDFFDASDSDGPCGAEAPQGAG